MTKREKFLVDLLKKVDKFRECYTLEINDKYIIDAFRASVFVAYIKEPIEEDKSENLQIK